MLTDAERQYLMIEAERIKNAPIIKANGTAEAIEMARAVPGEQSESG